MLSFLEYITEALTKRDIAGAKRNMARIAREVMAREKAKKTRDSGLDWTEEDVAGWWHPRERAVIFQWGWGRSQHLNQIVRYPQTFGVTDREIQSAVEAYTRENSTLTPDSPSWAAEVKHNREEFRNGGVDSYGPLAALAFRNGWVQVRWNDMAGVRTGVLMGPRASVRGAFREMLNMIDSVPGREPEYFNMEAYFKDGDFRRTQFQPPVRIKSRADLERLVN